MLEQTTNQRYQIMELIGEGAMGKVYHALDRLTGTVIALKSVHTSPQNLSFASRGTDEQDLKLALAGEFQVLASLRHPHIVGVKDYGFDAEQRPYFTMEFLENAQTILDVGRTVQPSEQARLLGQLLL